MKIPTILESLFIQIRTRLLFRSDSINVRDVYCVAVTTRDGKSRDGTGVVREAVRAQVHR